MRYAPLRTKGFAQEEFNWIFVLVAGAIITFFFFHFLTKQQAMAMEKNALTISSQLESIAAGVQSAQDAAVVVQVPKTTLAISCTRSCECGFNVVGAQTQKPFKDKFIFGAAHTAGPDLIIASKPWDVPYTVANFLYVTSPAIRYAFGYIDDDGDSEKMFRQVMRYWPSNIPYTTVIISPQGGGFRLFREYDPTQEYENEHFDKTRFVLFNPGAGSSTYTLHSSFGPKDYSILQVEGTTDIKGTMTFMRPTTGGMLSTPVAYFGSASLYGGIFSEDANLYYCNMKRGILRINQSLRVLANRTQRLSHYWGTQGAAAAGCQSLHRLMYKRITGVDFNGLSQTPQGIMQTLPAVPAEGTIVTITDITTFSDQLMLLPAAMERFAQTNFELNLNSCIEVY